MLDNGGKQVQWSSLAANEPSTVLLQRAASRARSGRSMLFRKPTEIIEARQPADVPKAFAAIEEKLAQGFHLAGYIAYEAGFALEPALDDRACMQPDEEPLLWMGCYGAPEVREEHLPWGATLPGGAPVRLRNSLARETYEEKVELLRSLIAAGETYQANLTMDVEWDTDEHPAEMYERLLRAQPVPYAALLHAKPGWHLLSLSPELFFAREGDHILMRPMKGTASPGMDSAETRAQAAWLQADEKNRAENVMIVDLVRSDLGRICQTGSVHVTKLFDIERYPTVLQMTSTVEGRLREHLSYEDLFRALFPSGSIVGAPKIHTMRLLHALEGRRRRVYTGAIGYIFPCARAEFNVAIRTVSLRKGKARLGVGSGITFDSEPALEFAECLGKTLFLTREPEQEFQLIETLLLQQGTFTLLEEHLERMAQSAGYFEFVFDEARIRTALRDAAQSWKGKESARVRLLLDREGVVRCTISKLQSGEGSSVGLLLWRERTLAGDRFLRHKTTRRTLYDAAFRHAQAHGFADSLFRNTRQEITEGAIYNVIASIAGEWITPPLESGVLPGLYRRHLLEKGTISQRVLNLSDLLRAEEILICNSVRGLCRVMHLAQRSEDGGAAETIWTAKISPQKKG